MSEMKLGTYNIQSVEIGKESTLPALEGMLNLQQQTTGNLDENDNIFLGYGFCKTVFPYRQQDVYSRQLQPTQYMSVTLENEHLKAVFLPQLGGRLISLVDKAKNKDLLFSNKQLYVGNLATRNSWFSGGVEWNTSIVGHSPFTCAPLFTAKTTLADGTPVLRMYEYERIRGMVFQMDFFLPSGSKMLYARVRLVNETDEVVPAYWWSNMALPALNGARVVTDGDTAFTNQKAIVNKETVPVNSRGEEITWPQHNPLAVDYFWNLPETSRRYVAYLDKQGWGLVQTSTARERGRKLFVWGQGQGGHHWQEYLAGEAGEGYIEVQAGLAKTQYECLPMPPHTAWEWLEAYGPLQADAAAVQGEWSAAGGEVKQRLAEILSAEALEDLLAYTKNTMAKQPAAELLLQGSSWGALEVRRRALHGETPLSPHLDFGQVTGETAQWLKLFQEGTLGEMQPDGVPPSFAGEPAALHALQNAVKHKDKNNWYTHMQLGATLLAAGQVEKARAALNQSLALQLNAWSLYALSCLEENQGVLFAACGHIKAAQRLRPADASLAKSCLRLLIKAEEFEQAMDVYNRLPAEIQALGRVRLYLATALVGVNRLDEAEAILLEGGGLIVPDVRESERSTSDIWQAIQQRRHGLTDAEAAACPVPYALDFRMF